MENKIQIHAAWIGFQRRQVSLSNYIPLDLFFYEVPRKVSNIKKFFHYVSASIATLLYFIRKSPDVIWVQVPQIPLLWVALFYKTVSFKKNVFVIADCHNAVFRKPWLDFPFAVSSLNKADIILIHNDSLINICNKIGVNQNDLLVLEDPPASIKSTNLIPQVLNGIGQFAVFPASFAEDEPIHELLDAASHCNSIYFVITGSLKNLKDKSILEKKPCNVIFTDFLPLDDFDTLITNSHFVFALTKFDGIQLSVCGEAVGAAKPMIISDTTLLRALYPEGTVFVKHDTQSFVDAINQMLKTYTNKCEEMNAFRARVDEKWRESRLKPLLERIEKIWS